MKRSLHVIPCGKKKIWDVEPTHPPAYAKDAYVGTFHRICRHYVHHFDVDWVILSAKYGFLLPNDIVSHNYDLTWNASHKKDWISMERLRDQVQEEKLHNYERLVLLTGKKHLFRISHLYVQEKIHTIRTITFLNRFQIQSIYCSFLSVIIAD